MYEFIKVVPIRERWDLANYQLKKYVVSIEIKFEDNSRIIEDANIVKHLFGNYDFSFGLELTETLSYWEEENINELYQIIIQEIEKEIRFNQLLLVPLKQWYCDKCNHKIHDENGILELNIREDDYKVGKSIASNFKIIHHDCHRTYEELSKHRGSSLNVGLDSPDLLARLFAISECYIVDTEEDFKEIVKRLTLPYYEQARKYFDWIQIEGYTLDFSFMAYDRGVLRDLIIKNLEAEYFNIK